MLNKAALKAIPTSFPQSVWMDLLKQAPHIRYYAAAQIKIIDHHQTLILDMYTYNNIINIEKPTYRVFLTTQDDLTLHFADGKMKWLTGRLNYLIAGCSCIFLDTDSIDAINRFFKQRRRALQAAYQMVKDYYVYYNRVDRPIQLQMIFIWQWLIRKNKLDKRHKEECRSIDRLMRTMRPLPKAFYKWIEDDALLHSRYIYYQYQRRKVLDGFCTHCLQDVQITGAKHNKSGICPHCGSKITFKAISRARDVSDKTNVVYFQKIHHGFVIRYFCVKKIYRDYHKPKLELTEILRTFYLNDIEYAGYYYFGEYKNTGVYRWCLVSDGGINVFCPQIYSKNLSNVLQGTSYQYCALEQYTEHTPCFMPYRYLQLYKLCPGLEYLVKAKLFTLIDNFIDYGLPKQLQNSKAKSLTELLGVNKYYLKKMIATDATTKEYEIYRILSDQQILLNDEQIAFVLANFSEYKLRLFIELLYITKRPIKTMHYLIKSAKLSQNSIYTTASDWKDYIDMCQWLQYDLTIERNLYPTNLQTAHVKVVALYKAEENVIYDRYLAESYPDTLKRYYYETEQFLIEIPQSSADLINEGAALSHCVGQYAQDILKQKCIVLFLRQRSAPTKPFYTLEIRQDHVIQCRTKYNKTAENCGDVDVLDFLKQFEANVLKADIGIAA